MIRETVERTAKAWCLLLLLLNLITNRVYCFIACLFRRQRAAEMNTLGRCGRAEWTHSAGFECLAEKHFVDSRAATGSPRLEQTQADIVFYYYYHYFFSITFEVKASTMLICKPLHRMRGGQALQLWSPRNHGVSKVKDPRLSALNLLG